MGWQWFANRWRRSFTLRDQSMRKSNLLRVLQCFGSANCLMLRIRSRGRMPVKLHRQALRTS